MTWYTSKAGKAFSGFLRQSMFEVLLGKKVRICFIMVWSRLQCPLSVLEMFNVLCPVHAWDYWCHPKTVPLRAVFISLVVCLFLKGSGGTGSKTPDKQKEGLGLGKGGHTLLWSALILLQKIIWLTYFLGALQIHIFMLNVLEKSCWFICLHLPQERVRDEKTESHKYLFSVMCLESCRRGFERILLFQFTMINCFWINNPE